MTLIVAQVDKVGNTHVSIIFYSMKGICSSTNCFQFENWTLSMVIQHYTIVVEIIVHTKKKTWQGHMIACDRSKLCSLCDYVTKNSFILNNLWTLNTTNIQIRKINVRIQLTTLWEHLNIIWYLLVWNIQHTFQKIFAWQLQFSSSVLCNKLLRSMAITQA